VTLPAGSRLGPYEILAPLGAGGMGEVYRARDARLGREVALKVLPPELSENRDRLSRFEQEARSASALNHPNIVTVHDIGRSDATSYIAMELVEGKTLRELSSGDPLPVRRVLTLAVQIADGLAKAHAAGIVHRDLKPENVMVSKDGFVKILDFGLAKLVEPESGQVSVMPTLAQPETHPGVVMGTVGYMSPEQASGEPVDFRSDQFSFGSILYEVASGQKPFQRKTAAETMSAIIRDEPEPIAKVRADVPPPLRWIVERCLAKDPDERYVSTRDLARDLASVRDHVSEISGAAEPPVDLGPRPLRRARRATILGVALLLLLGGALAGWLAAAKRTPKASAPTFRRLTFRSGDLSNARFSPDGETIVYGARWAGAPPDLYAVRPEGPESRPFGMPDADILAISRSGEMAVLLNLGVVSGTLARVPFAGGVPRPVVEGVPYASADWSPDGRHLVILRGEMGRFRLEFPVGKVLYEGSQLYAPRVSPDGNSIAFFRLDTGSVMAIGRSGDHPRTVSTGWSEIPGGAPCWTPDGKEIWFNASADPGKPTALYATDLAGKVRRVAQLPGILELDDISRDGRVLLAHHTLIDSLWGLGPGDTLERDLTWLDGGIPVDLSADGKTIFFTEWREGGGKNFAVYLRKMDGSPAVRLGEGQGLALSPDGKWMLTRNPNASDRFVLLPTGAGEPKTLVLTGLETSAQAAWLPDGKRLVFSGNEKGKGIRVYLLDVENGVPRPISPEGVDLPFVAPLMPAPTAVGTVSPDGRWFLGRRDEVFSRYPIEGGDPRRIAGLEGGERPIRWSSDGRSIYVGGPRGATKVWRLDPETGRRTLWKEIKPADPATGVRRLVIAADGRSYAYGARRGHAVLYVVEGLK
jgi:eukaryotic-like serine/threonine-protein kinase